MIPNITSTISHITILDNTYKERISIEENVYNEIGSVVTHTVVTH